MNAIFKSLHTLLGLIRFSNKNQSLVFIKPTRNYGVNNYHFANLSTFLTLHFFFTISSVRSFSFSQRFESFLFLIYFYLKTVNIVPAINAYNLQTRGLVLWGHQNSLVDLSIVA